MSLHSISPIDGRYKKYTDSLIPYFSEAASMKYKIIMEGEYFIALSESRCTGLRRLSDKEKAVIRKLYSFTLEDAQMTSDIELNGYKDIKATNHDFKAIEYFIKEKLSETSLKDVIEWVHFGLTSEDASNIAYALMISESVRDVYLPTIEKLTIKIGKLSRETRKIPMLARTHGQPASPSTFGKEFKIFYERLIRQIEQIKKHKILAKLNGATGNYNALAAAYPKADWVTFSGNCIRKISKERGVNLGINLHTTQIEPHDSYIELFDIMRRINSILIDFDQDVWRYISDGWIAQKPVEGEVGSSTMPHKINPWFLENSEGNLSVANALFEFFGRKLPVSRLQRDLSDSTVQRNIGVAFAHSLIGFVYLNNQLGRITVNREKALADLEAHPEVIAEAIQTILRREGIAMPYEQLKALTRGRKVTRKDFEQFINGLEIDSKIKRELKKFTAAKYTGLASKLA